jgi:hypothetical protein
MMKIGIIGASSIGDHYLKSLGQSARVDIAGCYDTDYSWAESFASKNGLIPFKSIDALLHFSDALLFTSPLENFSAIVCQSLRQMKHVFLHSLVPYSIHDATQFLKLADESGVVMYAGMSASDNVLIQGGYIHEKAEFVELSRVQDHLLPGFDWVKEWLFQDVDIVQVALESSVMRVSACGYSFPIGFSVVNIHLFLDNGGVAVFRYSRSKGEKSHEIVFHGQHTTTRVDMKRGEVEVRERSECVGQEQVISLRGMTQSNGIDQSLSVFLRAVQSGDYSSTNLRGSWNTLVVVNKVLSKLDSLRAPSFFFENC